jgi:hypothetical protein
LGKEVASLVSEELGAGNYVVRWQGDVPSGTYIYRLQAGDASTGSAHGFMESKRMVLLR